MATSPQATNEELSVALLNINGLRNKTNDVQHIIRRDKIHVLALCETKLDPSVKDSKVYIPGFRMWRKDRNNKGGGVALYIQDHIETTLRSDLMKTRVEIIWVEMEIPGREPVLLGCCYRPPNNDLKRLVEIYETMTCVHSMMSENEMKDILVMGDFNVKWDTNLKLTKKAVDILSKSGLEQIVKVKTKFAKKSSSCIDHIYTNVPELCSEPKSIVTGCSDHNLVTVTVSKNIPLSRRSNQFDQNEFNKDIPEARSSDEHQELKKALLRFIKTFLKIADKHAPLQAHNIYESLRLSDELETLILKRDQAKKKEGYYDKEYKNLKKMVINCSKRENRICLKQQLEKVKDAPKNFFKVYKEYLGKSLPSQVFNINPEGDVTSDIYYLNMKHFINVSLLQSTSNAADSFSFDNIDPERGNELFKLLLSNVTHEIYKIDAKMLQLVDDDISGPSSCDNVHVILGYVFDIILFTQAKQYFIGRGEIPSKPLDEIKQIETDWLTATKNSKRVQAVFLDFSSLFDTISHDLLIEKLRSSGFSDSALSLIRSFLSCREGSRGLPRGSFLARLLFSFFINDLKEGLKSSSAVICQNHVIIYAAHKDSEVLNEQLNADIQIVSNWANISTTLLNKITQTIKPTKSNSSVTNMFEVLRSFLDYNQFNLNWIQVFRVIMKHRYPFRSKECIKTFNKLQQVIGIKLLKDVPAEVLDSLVLLQLE